VPIELTPEAFIGELESSNFTKWLTNLKNHGMLDDDSNERSVQFYVASYFANKIFNEGLYYPKKILLEKNYLEDKKRIPDIQLVSRYEEKTQFWMEIKVYLNPKKKPSNQDNEELNKDLRSISWAKGENMKVRFLIIESESVDVKDMVRNLASEKYPSLDENDIIFLTL
tara:strand:- start:34 stop:540 length:507 start_codon:yes stop_codon:yes gene_type:complete